jgi:hypothetical protein
MNRRRRIPDILAALTLAGMLVPLLASPAAAHEHRKVGKYNLVVGFGTEPAFTGNPNSVQLILTDAKDKPVTTLRDTLKVAVTSGNAEAKEMTLEPNFGDGWGEQGDYRPSSSPPPRASTASSSAAPSAARRSTRPSPAAPRASRTWATRPSSSTRSRTQAALSSPPASTAKPPAPKPP